MQTYRLGGPDGKTPVLCPDFLTWSLELEAMHRVVARTEIKQYGISTIFLGLNHNFGAGPPILWETMIFGYGKLSGSRDRCSGSWEQAEAMHERMCQKVREALASEKLKA